MQLKIRQKDNVFLAILCDLFGMVEWPFQRLSDLQLGDKKVTLNHLVEEYCKLQVPKLAFRRKNASKTFFYVVFKLDTLPFQSESIVTGMYSCTKKKDRSLKHATLLRYKRLWKRDRKLFREDFFPPFARRTAQWNYCTCSKHTTPSLMKRWVYSLKSKRHLTSTCYARHSQVQEHEVFANMWIFDEETEVVFQWRVFC